MLRAFMALKPSRPLYPAEVCKFTDLVEIYCILQQYAASSPSYSLPTMNISNGVQGAGKFDVPQFQTLMLPPPPERGKLTSLLTP